MLIIREATINDAEIIHQLAEKVWWPSYAAMLADDQIVYMLQERYSTELLTTQIEQNLQTYLLAIEDDLAIGFASFSSTGSDYTVYHLHKLYCLPSTKGKGHGKALLFEIIDRVKHLGAKRLELNVHRENPAKTFYDKMGFEITKTVDTPMGPYFLNDYIMVKQL